MTPGADRWVPLRHGGTPTGAVAERERIDREWRGGRVGVARVHVRVDGEANVRQQGGGRSVPGLLVAAGEVRVGVARDRPRRLELEDAEALLVRLRWMLVLPE